MQHRKLTCNLDVVFVWSVGGRNSAKTVNLACESSSLLQIFNVTLCYVLAPPGEAGWTGRVGPVQGAPPASVWEVQGPRILLSPHGLVQTHGQNHGQNHGLNHGLNGLLLPPHELVQTHRLNHGLNYGLNHGLNHAEMALEHTPPPTPLSARDYSDEWRFSLKSVPQHTYNHRYSDNSVPELLLWDPLYMCLRREERGECISVSLYNGCCTMSLGKVIR
jgi:hypothetical protein